MNFFKYTSILIFVLLGHLSFGQNEILSGTLLGKVMTLSDSSTISGVSIYLKNEKIGTADSYGNFEVQISSGDIIRFDFPEYISITKTITSELIKENLILEIYLEEIFYELARMNSFDEEITTGSKKAKKISDIPASVVIVTKEEIRNFGYRNLEDILNNIPGLFPVGERSWDGGGTNYGVRGFFSPGFNTDMIVLVNGVNQYEGYWGFYPMSRMSIPVETIERIEIVRGPMAITYGNGAFFGAINIITHNNYRDKKKEVEPIFNTEQSVIVGLGSEGTRKFAGSIEKKYGDLSLSFGGGLLNTFGPGFSLSDIAVISDSLINVGYSVDTDDQNSALNGNILEDNRSFLNFSARKGKFTVAINFGEAKKEMFLSLTPTVIDSSKTIKFNSISHGEGTVARLNGINGNVTYTNPLKNGLILLQSSLEMSSHRSFMDYASSGTFYGLSSFFSNSWASEGSALIDFSKLPNRTDTIRLTWLTGINNTRIEDLHTAFDLPQFGTSSTNSYVKIKDKDGISTFSFFNQFEYQVTKRLNITAGLRIDKTGGYLIEQRFGNSATVVDPVLTDLSALKTNFVPRIASIFKLNDKNIVKLLFGQAIKRPSFGENTDVSISTLKPAKISTYEVNYIKSIEVSDNSILLFNVSAFRNDLIDLITRSSSVQSDGSISYVSNNGGQMNTHGLELTIDYKSKISRGKKVSKFNAMFSLSYLKSKELSTVPVFSENAGSYDSLYITPGVGFSPNILFYGKVSYSPINRLNIALNGRYVGKMNSEWSYENYVNSIQPGKGFPDISTGYLANDASGYFVLDGNFNYAFKVKTKENIGNNKSIDRNGFLNVGIKINNLFNTKYHSPVTSNNSWADKGFLGNQRLLLLTLNWSI